MKLSPLSKVLTFFLLVIPSYAFSQECNCTIFPFKPVPPCLDRCTVFLTLEADLDRLQDVLDLTDSEVQALLRFRSNAGFPKNLSDLSREMPESDFRSLKAKLWGLNKAEFESLR